MDKTPRATRHKHLQTAIGRSTRLGELLLRLGHLRPDQLAAALDHQRRQPPAEREPLGAICVAMGFLAEERLDRILDRWGKRLRLSEMLVHRKRISQAQLLTALVERQRGGRRLGEILLEQKAIEPESLAETLSEHFDIPYVPLADLQPEPELVRYVNEIFALRNHLVPVGRLGRQITVAIADPTRRDIARELERSSGLKVRLVLATPQEIERFAAALYGRATGILPAVEPNPATEPRVASGPDPSAESREILRRIVTVAASRSATALTLEPTEQGTLAHAAAEGGSIPIPGHGISQECLAGILFELKRLAHLDSAETRRPQEGVLVVQTDEGDHSRPVSLRLTVVPGPLGESAHLRFLDRRRPSRAFEEVGLLEATSRRLERALDAASGLFLIAGPPGSGKRSTLRACAAYLQRKGRGVMSIEDPIVFVQDGITQVQIDQAIGNTYARYLRSFLPLQPNAILMDHLDGGESADLALGVGADGPLILATLRATNATDSINRLYEMGTDANLIASGLAGVFGQRLMRRNCPHCAIPYEPSPSAARDWFGDAPLPAGLKRGSGCDRCGGTAFLGRVVVSELWIPTDEEAAMIAGCVSGDLLHERVLQRIGSLVGEALRRVLAGESTLEEALRVVPRGDLLPSERGGAGRGRPATGSNRGLRAA